MAEEEKIEESRDGKSDEGEKDIKSSVERFEKILQKRKTMIEDSDDDDDEESDDDDDDDDDDEEDEVLDEEEDTEDTSSNRTPLSNLSIGMRNTEIERRFDALKKEQVRIANMVTRFLSDFEEDKRRIAILDERLNTLLKKDEKQENLLATIDNKLAQILEKEKAEQERIERLSQLRKLEEDELSDSIAELSEIYEMTQKKLAVAREDMELVKEKLIKVLEGQRMDEEKKLISLTRAHELTQQRLEALDDLRKLKDPSEKERSLITMLKKRKEELEQELEGEIAGDPVKLAALLRRERAKGALPPAGAAKIITCPSCSEKFEVTSPERPLKIQCPSCGAVGVLKK